MEAEAKEKILVIDDEAKWLRTINLILSPDYDLTCYQDCFQGIELLRTHQFSLVILDQKFPGGVSGLNVFRQMQEQVPDLRAIILTGYADVELAVESMKMGVLDYIPKGANDLTGQLRARVKEALQKELSPGGERSAKSSMSEGEFVLSLISRGEGAELEFKSSVRWDMRDNKVNRELEKVVIKTVAGFLNSDKGGNLLIGVGDNGTILGLEPDYRTFGKKMDRDGYEAFLTSLLLDSYGKECSPFIQITFHSIDGKDVGRIAVRPSAKPIFVADEKGEHLFLRTGNSTRLLSTREAIEYCKIRWK